MDAKPLPARPKLEQFQKQAKDLLRSRTAPETVQRIKRFHPRFSKFTEDQLANAQLSLADARRIIAHEHAFESWPRFVKHIQALVSPESRVSRFEKAADAIVSGDSAALKRLLRKDPSLVRAKSTRSHGAPLIHYVAANGIENFRQKTPKNIIEITQLLLEAGADVDATTKAYGSASTALGLAATSYHPAKAGVQLELLELLLEAGACVDGAAGGWNPLVAALHNGRGKAAVYLAERGAVVDLEGAAGTGLVEEVARYVSNNGRLKAGATKEKMHYGVIWACEYGHSNVVKFLLERGVKLDPDFMHGQTPLHWAALAGHAEVTDLLLEAEADVNAKERIHGGTPLGWAVYGWINPAPEFTEARHHEVAERLIAAGAKVDWEWLDNRNRGPAFGTRLRADRRMMAALRSAD